MCVYMGGGGSHFRERGVLHRGFTKRASQGVHEKGGSHGGSREPCEPPGYGPDFLSFHCIKSHTIVNRPKLIAIMAADCCSTDTLVGLDISNMVLSST